jgi:hypothetical protein
MQKQMAQMQEELATRTVEATAGGGLVTVVVTGGLEVQEIKIDQEALDPEDMELLEDAILVAVNEALKKAQEMVASEMSKITGGLNIPGLF